jgi:hypothetical protein
MIMLALGALALLLYFIGWIVPAAIAIAVGFAVLVWSVLTHR